MASKISRSKCPEPVSVTLHSKRDSAHVIKVRILRWADYPGGPHANKRVPIRGRPESQSKRGDIREGKLWE